MPSMSKPLLDSGAEEPHMSLKCCQARTQIGLNPATIPNAVEAADVVGIEVGNHEQIEIRNAVAIKRRWKARR